MPDPRPTILIVEDEPDIRQFLRSAFALEGYRVVEATSGRRAAIDAGTHKPDLAIVDLGLPDIDGVDVIRRIREWSPSPQQLLTETGIGYRMVIDE
jgi:two-component system, OmpR family, KDP operon response regulator KdpE